MIMEDIEKSIGDILRMQESNIIAYMASDGMHLEDADGFISQSAEGILFDLNRNIATTATLAKAKGSEIGLRWVNDLAVAYTIIKLKEKIERLEKKLINNGKDTKQFQCRRSGNECKPQRPIGIRQTWRVLRSGGAYWHCQDI